MATVSTNHRTDLVPRDAAASARPRQGCPSACLVLRDDLGLNAAQRGEPKIINQGPLRPCGQETVSARLVSAIRGSAAVWLHLPRPRRAERQLRHAWPDRVP